MGLLLKSLATLLCLGTAGWGALALWYQGPAPLPLRLALITAWLVAGIGSAIGLWWWPQRAALVWTLALVLLAGWWLQLKPQATRDWADEVAHLAVGTVDGNVVTLPYVRDFRWHAGGGYEARWEARRYELDRLRSVDLILSHWGVPGIAHTLVSFGFDDGRQLVFSVEIRKQRGERYSTLGGFFKQFEASVIAADERDIIAVRTNVRGEDDYLYRVQLGADERRSLLLAYVDQANRLAAKPRFYNTITANCTTVVYRMVERIIHGLPLDYRLVFSGLLPEYIHKLGGFTPGYSLEQLRSLGRISERARAAGDGADFSQAIRRGVPGVESAAP